MKTEPSQAALAARERRVRRGRDQEAAAKRRSLQSMIEMPLLEALAEKGGAARPRDIYGEIAERLNLDPDIRDERRSCDGQDYAVFDQQVRWTRQTLVGQQLIAGRRGVWELTDKGREKLTRVQRGKVILIYSLDDGLAFLAHAEEAAGAIAPDSLSLIMTSPPYPVVNREYGRFSVPEWLDWMGGLVGLWRDLLREDGTLAVNLGDVFVPGTPTLSPYVERFTLDTLDRHGMHLASRLVWASNNKLPALEWCVRRGAVLRNAVEHVLLFSKSAMPSWDNRRVPREPYVHRSAAQIASDARRTNARRPGGYDINEAAFSRTGEGRIASNLIVSGGVGGGGIYAKRCREAGFPLHPARFPEEVPRRVIQLTTAPGQTVYDPMAGSNTTGKVALDLGRRFISSEPVLEYAQGSAFRFDHRADFRAHPIPA